MKRITQWSTKAVVHKGQLSRKGSQLRLAPLSRRQFLKATGLAGVTAGIQPPLVRARGLRRSKGEPVGEGIEIYLSDLEKCQPSAALSERSAPGVWRMLQYKSRAFSGTMLVATEESDAPDVSYSLGRSGWHKIYIGIYRKPFEQPKQVQVKLSDDPAYTILAGRPGETDHQENWIDDIYWKTAHLNGRDIVIRQIKLPRVQHSWVGYIKLVSLSEEEVRAVREDRSRTGTKRLFVHSDAHLSNVTGSIEEILKYLEPLRNTDVARIYWEAGGGDRTLYFSGIGRDHASALENSPVFFPRVIDREWALTWQAYRQKGTDQLRVAAEFAKKIGLEFHAAYRTAGFVHPPPYDDIGGGGSKNILIWFVWLGTEQGCQESRMPFRRLAAMCSGCFEKWRSIPSMACVSSITAGPRSSLMKRLWSRGSRPAMARTLANWTSTIPAGSPIEARHSLSSCGS